MTRKKTKKQKRPAKRPVQHPKARDDRSPLTTRIVLATLVSIGTLLVAGALAYTRGDGGSAGEGSVEDAVHVADDAGPIHVHGLGINPADGSLLIATHTGMYRVAPGQKRAERIGQSRQDTMGFTVAGPNYFLGSGHPDLEEAVERDLPPHLGLIESQDAGRTWRPISLLGQADFHVLRFAADRIYGYDASNERLLVSRDNGRSWHDAERPARLLDLAVDPANSRRVLASGEGGLYVSTDEGGSWKRIGPQIGLLAWPATDRVYLVDGSGGVSSSANGGRAWTRVGNVRGRPAALLAHTQNELHVALHDGTILHSRNGGQTWAVRSTPGSS